MKYLKLFENYNSSLSLTDTLIKFGIPVDQWGKGAAKNIKNLQTEIDEKETTLEENNGELIRKVCVVAVAVECNGKRLIEDRQEFNDGRVRRRGTKRCGEKCIEGEIPQQAAIRCLTEELGLENINPANLIFEKTNQREMLSMSYPGLKSKYYTSLFYYNMPEDQYNPDGYIEVQSDKKTYFVWK